jgi:F-type H+-transporting ATPase subunit b
VDAPLEDLHAVFTVLQGQDYGDYQLMFRVPSVDAMGNLVLDENGNPALTDVKNQIGNMVIEISEKVIRRSLEQKSEQENYIRQLADDVQLLGKR